MLPLVFSTSSIARYETLVVGGILGGVFLDHGGLSFCHPSGYVCLLYTSIYFDNQSVMDGRAFLNPYPSMAFWTGDFHFGTFLSVLLSDLMCILAFGAFSSPFNSFTVLLIH